MKEALFAGTEFIQEDSNLESDFDESLLIDLQAESDLREEIKEFQKAPFNFQGYPIFLD